MQNPEHATAPHDGLDAVAVRLLALEEDGLLRASSLRRRFASELADTAVRTRMEAIRAKSKEST